MYLHVIVMDKTSFNTIDYRNVTKIDKVSGSVENFVITYYANSEAQSTTDSMAYSVKYYDIFIIGSHTGLQ